MIAHRNDSKIRRAEAEATAREARSAGRIGRSDWKRLAIATWTRASADNLGLISAGVAFYTFLALVPLLGATVLTYGLFATPGAVLRNVQSLTAVMPAEAAKLVGEQLLGVIATSTGKKGLGLAIALAVALFGARNAAGSVITALNIAYEEKETRSFFAFNLLALAMTAGGIVTAIVAMASFAALGSLDDLLPGLPGLVLWLGRILSYAALLAGGAAGAATLYRFAPDHSARWRWISPGTLLASAGWILLSLGFSVYAANFGNYGKAYGSLATVVVLLTWVYLSAYLLLFGAELNAELERKATASKASSQST